jgi:hypothetical protein
MSTMRPVRSIATALLVASVAVAGCARSQPDQRDTAAKRPPTISAPATSPPAVTAPPATPAPPPKAPARSEPVVLADGRHPVYLKTIDPDRRTITFDLIQMYWGEDAAREAAKDHQESPPPNDYYIRNVNPRLRTLPVRSDATITVNTLASSWTGSATKNVPVTLAKLASLTGSDDHGPPFYITVRHDQVVKIAEQYVP